VITPVSGSGDGSAGDFDAVDGFSVSDAVAAAVDDDSYDY